MYKGSSHPMVQVWNVFGSLAECCQRMVPQIIKSSVDRNMIEWLKD